MARTLSARGAALIAEFEGKVNHLYDDPAGHCTIGIGHLVHHGPCDGSEPEEFRRGLSDQEVYDLFIADAQRYVDDVNRLVKVPLNQNQFDALVSLDYNLGPGGWTGLLDALNRGDYQDAAARFGRYVYAGGQILQGLVRRRAAEVDLFRTPATGPEPLPPGYENLHPAFARRLVRLNAACGTWVYSGWRSSQRQKELYDGWRAGLPGYNPANPPGTSNHEAVPYGTPLALAADLAGNLDEAHRRAGEFGVHFPIASEAWHAQPVEVASATYQGMPGFPEDYDPLPDPKEEPEMAIAIVTVDPGEMVSIPLPQQGTRFGTSLVSVTLTAGPEDVVVRAVIGPDWHGLDPDHAEDLVVPPDGRRFEDLGPGSNVLQVTNRDEGNQSVGVLVEAK